MFSAMSVLANFLINNQPWLSGIWKFVANLDEMKWNEFYCDAEKLDFLMKNME